MLQIFEIPVHMLSAFAFTMKLVVVEEKLREQRGEAIGTRTGELEFSGIVQR